MRLGWVATVIQLSYADYSTQSIVRVKLALQKRNDTDHRPNKSTHEANLNDCGCRQQDTFGAILRSKLQYGIVPRKMNDFLLP